MIKSKPKSHNIEIKLLEVLKDRNSTLFWPHIGLVLFSFFFLTRNQDKSFFLFLPFHLIFLSLSLRIFVLKKNFDSFTLKKNLPFFLYLVFVAFTGSGWGLLFRNVYFDFGLFSIEAFFCIGVIITLVSGGVTAFAPYEWAGRIFMISLTFIPASLFLFHADSSYFFIGLLFIGNLIYQMYHLHISHKFLKKALINESLATGQLNVLQNFIDSIPCFVAFIDRSGIYRLVNNYPNSDFKSVLNSSVGDEGSNPVLAEVIRNFILSKDTEAVHEVRIDSSGIEQWYMINLKSMITPYDGVVLSILPITELVKAKNDLKIQEARSQYASKLASLGEFSAGIAHEVNNPLTIIEGTASLMKVVLSENPIDKDLLLTSTQKIMNTTQRISRIIKGLRSLSGDAQDEPFQNVSFKDIVGPALEITKGKLTEFNIRLTIDGTAHDVPLFGNEIQLSQVMLNLISNSIDAVKNIKGERWIHVEFIPTIEWLEILVSDNGNGVHPEIQEKIMDPFFTTKNSDQGTGLGLSISKSILESHLGNLSLYHDKNRTFFKIRFPRMNSFS